MSYSYISAPEQSDPQIYMTEGQSVAGSAIGILVLDLWFMLLPGNVANASSYSFPVLFKVLKGTTFSQVKKSDPVLGDLVINGGRELQRMGVRAIVGACGYFANYQRSAARALKVPVFLSSLLQIHLILPSLRSDQKIGIICADKEALKPAAFAECGITDLSRLVITGAQDIPDFFYKPESGYFNGRRLEKDLVELAYEFVCTNPDIGAVLLECSDLPPHSRVIQNAIKRPVFDYMTLIDWVWQAAVKQQYQGFI